MSIMSFIMCCICISSLFFGIQVLIRPESQKNAKIIFTLLCFTNAVLSFAYTFLLTSDSIDQLVTFRYFVVVCLPLVAFLSACLMLSLSKNSSKYLKIVLAGLGIFGVVVIILISSGDTIEYVNNSVFTVNYTFHNSIGITMLGLHEFIAQLICAYILLAWMKNATIQRDKLQAWVYLIACIFVSISLMLVTLIPIFGVAMPPLSSVFIFMFIVFVYYISRRYNSFNITFENIAKQIYSDVQLPIIVTDSENNIILVNENTFDFFRIEKDRIYAMGIADLFADSQTMWEALRDIVTDNLQFETKSANGEYDLEVQKTNFKDQYDDLICSIFMIHDITQSKELISQLNDSVIEAEIANKAKSSFLANMSHEIRTPMNAIIGMAEIALQKEIDPETAAHLTMIQSSGLGLVTIINDILDFSKIESGKMEIVESDYIFSSIIVDIVNMFAVKLMNSDVTFIVNVNPNIPMHLVGDEIRIKQILVNIIGNAVKFTKKGFIKLDIDGYFADKDAEKYTLKFKVTDTGIGIKEEDMTNLFGMFSQVDTKKNRAIRGTGLGLSISKDLCIMMGGDIEVESTYGKGSVFTINLIQKVRRDNAPLTFVEKPQDKYLCIYEPDDNLRMSFEQMLTNLNVPHTIHSNPAAYLANLEQKKATHTAIREELLISPIKNAVLAVQNSTDLILVTNIYSKPNMEIQCNEVYLPLYSFQMADILNNREPQMFVKNGGAGTNFISLPDVKVLVVDDTYSNLRVAQGLLAPYKMTVDLAASGKEAIAMVKKNKYDAVFMDHMMPEMDGVEAAKIIRSLGEEYKDLPLIALTANATVGAREMFINEGFDDFIAKPIDISKLRAVVKKWLGGKNPRFNNETFVFESPEAYEKIAIDTSDNDLIDYDKGLSFLGGNPQQFFNILKTYYLCLGEKKDTLCKSLAAEDLYLYAITAHALKSSSMSLGIKAIPDIAYDLEKAGKNKDKDSIDAQHEKLISLLNQVEDEICNRFGEYMDMGQGEEPDADVKHVVTRETIDQQMLLELVEAVDFCDPKKSASAFKHIRKEDYPADIEELLKKLENYIEQSNFMDAESLLRSYMEM